MNISFSNNLIECGTDEAGRGCLAGPVTAAAVILPADFKHDEINDSKKLSAKKRNDLRKIIEHKALSFGIAHVSVEQIDEINILNAAILGMHKAIDQLKIKPEMILVDGNRFKPYDNIPHQCIIKGDQKFMSIAAASILAKSHRDELMLNLDKCYPDYQWIKNKGYPTQQHRTSIKLFGACKEHRRSFKLM